MKMKPEHYQLLKKAISGIDKQTVFNHRENLKRDSRVKDLDMRLRWDCLHASGVNVRPWYDYLDDTHIDTALKRIVKELEI